jgi:hypothetical protein
MASDPAGLVRAKGYAGLVNQGATCYLSSLLQTLFMLPEFRALVYRWRYTATSSRGVAKEKCIPYQLQKLFARMQLCTGAAASTQELTASFNWGSSEALQQHDVQELCRLLLDALEASLAGAPGGEQHEIRTLFQGELVDVVQCKPPETHESRRTDTFMDIPITVRPHDGRPIRSLVEGLSNFLVRETVRSRVPCAAAHMPAWPRRSTHTRHVALGCGPSAGTCVWRRLLNTLGRWRVPLPACLPDCALAHPPAHAAGWGQPVFSAARSESGAPAPPPHPASPAPRCQPHVTGGATPPVHVLPCQSASQPASQPLPPLPRCCASVKRATRHITSRPDPLVAAAAGCVEEPPDLLSAAGADGAAEALHARPPDDAAPKAGRSGGFRSGAVLCQGPRSRLAAPGTPRPCRPRCQPLDRSRCQPLDRSRCQPLDCVARS